MKCTARIVFVLVVIALVGNVPLFAQVTVVPFADRWNPEPLPVELPPWIPASEAGYKVLNVSTAVEVGNGAVGNVSAAASMDLGSSATQAIPGSRAGSFMSEQRLAERSLRGTIKRLG